MQDRPAGPPGPSDQRNPLSNRCEMGSPPRNATVETDYAARRRPNDSFYLCPKARLPAAIGRRNPCPRDNHSPADHPPALAHEPSPPSRHAAAGYAGLAGAGKIDCAQRRISGTPGRHSIPHSRGAARRRPCRADRRPGLVPGARQQCGRGQDPATPSGAGSPSAKQGLGARLDSAEGPNHADRQSAAVSAAVRAT
jgi:hypothetical protein